MDLIAYHLDYVNWVAVAVAILPSFVLGSFWYTPKVFGNYWMNASRLKKKDFDNANFVMALVKTTACNFVLVAGLALLMSALYLDTWQQGAALGALVSLVFVAMSRGVHLSFEYRPLGLFLINSTYDMVFLTLAGAIIGAFGGGTATVV